MGEQYRSISQILQKPAIEIQREDLLNVIESEGINQVNLHYVGLDGKLKELKIPVLSSNYIEMILAQGERIDGSSIFRGVIETGNSDLYIIPIYKTAFISPFEEQTMGVVCRFLDKNGEPALCAPDNLLIAAHERFKKNTGYTLNALGELEFYLMYDRQDELFAGMKQRGYHQSAPFVKGNQILHEIMTIISDLSGAVKYGHSEVGYIESLQSMRPEINGKCCEQFEIEFLPCPVEDMALYLTLAKWVIRNVAYRHGCTATFTPKLDEGIAGNGLHFHLALSKNNANCMTSSEGVLSEDAKKMIGGLCRFAGSLTAFGNSVSSAYLRLVPNQEAPTRVFWSEQNRHALVRIPLGWSNLDDLSLLVNPTQNKKFVSTLGRQTAELRSPDGSAFIHLLLSAITVVGEYGLTHPEMLEYAERLYGGLQKSKDPKWLASVEALPASCAEAADSLSKEKDFFVKLGQFPSRLIDYVIEKLYKEDDRNINERFFNLSASERLSATREIMHKDFHKH